MHALDVPGKVRFLSKLPRTLLTLERPFTGVASLMALRKQLRNSETMLSLRGIKRFCFCTASLAQTRIQCEVCRAEIKLFILLRLNMATE